MLSDGVNEETIELELGFWFRTWPIVLIISYDTENGRTEATALSCQKGLVSGGANISVPWSVLHWGDENGANVYHLIVCGAAYADYYMDSSSRETELTYLDFLTPP